MLAFKILRQQHFFSNWWMDVLEKQSNVLWQKICGSNGVGGGHQNLQPHDKFSTNWNLNYQDQMLSTSCFLILWWKEIFRVFICGVNIQNDTSALATAFYFNWCRMDDLENFFFVTNFFCDKNVSLVGGCQPRTSGFMPNALPFEVDSDLSLCQTE